ncbi:MAG: Na(+)-translocating NADH-quinone reductase subunit A [Pseudomonadota bacterium]
MRIDIKKGLDIPLEGAPEQVISPAPEVRSVAVVGTDVRGLRPRMAVAVGDKVHLGQKLFVDKRNPDVPFVAPGAGEVTEINRGARRALQSVVIRLEGDAAATYEEYSPAQLDNLDPAKAREMLVASGLWTFLRTRPFSHVPEPDAKPAAMFVTAIDTNPLAPDPTVVIGADSDAFQNGLKVVATLTDGPVYVCTAPDSGISPPDGERFTHAEFAGPHPAGLVGTHIHFLEPVGEGKSVWHLGYQHVMAIGKLFTTGRLYTDRVVAIAGPKALKPRLVRTRAGACIAELLKGETADGRLRVISGSVLSGHQAHGPLGYLGRYHRQVCILAEGEERQFMEWMRPGIKKYSVLRAYLGPLLKKGKFALTTTQAGSARAMVSTGVFESLMPLDILPTPLLKALLVQDTDRARELGCLELDEEDLALCSFVCNGKYEYGPFLRQNLEEIEVNG